MPPKASWCCTTSILTVSDRPHLPGAFSVEVSHRWIDTPAPYGPLWLLMGHIIAAVVGNHVGITVAVLRLLAIIGLLILAATVPDFG